MRKVMTGMGLAALLLAYSEPGLAGCAARHFYNNSNTAFKVGLQSGTCSVAGGGAMKTCVVPAGSSKDPAASTAEITFASSGSDQITVQSSDDTYASQTFDVTIGGSSCHIKHSGSTGNIVVNSDADGDVATCGPNFQGGTQRGNGHNGGYACQAKH